MEKTETSYRHDVDGLRAVAILAVLFYHAGFPMMQGGFVGVDVFFVISGYFVTSVLMKSLQKPNFGVWQFYRRRGMRIIPPLFAMAMCCVPAAYYLFLPQDYELFGKTLISVATFCSNLFFYSQGGYFDAPLEGNPFLHTWFLSIQAQFYLLLPLLLLLIRRRWKGKESKCIAFLLALSLAASVLTTRYAPQAAYFFLSSRGWELLLGALLAMRQSRVPDREQRPLPAIAAEALGLAAALAILAPIPLYSAQTPFPGLAAIPPCAGAFLLIWLPTVAERPPLVNRLLSSRPLTAVGVISYSLYLWHWPVLVFMKDFLLRERLQLRYAAVGVVVSLLIAWLSWRLLERPARTGASSGGKWTALFLPCLLLIMIAAGAVPAALSGLPGRLPPEAKSYAEALDEMRDAVKYAPCQVNDPNREWLDRVRRGDLCALGQADGAPPLFFSWGDSHMDHFRPLLRKIAEELPAHGLHLPTPGRLPLIGAYREYYDTPSQKRYFMEITAAAIDVVKEKRIPFVILSGNWPGAEVDLRAPLPNGETAQGLEALAVALENTIAALEDAGAAVWIVKPTPIFDISVPRRLIRDVQFGNDPTLFHLPFAEYKRRIAKTEAVFQAAAAKHPGVRFIDPAATLCADGKHCLASVDGKALYFDSNHLTTFGALYLEPSFLGVIEAMRLHVDHRAKE